MKALNRPANSQCCGLALFHRLVLSWFSQKFETFFQELFKEQIYFSRTLHGMSCHLFNKMNHSVQTKLAVFQCLVLLFQLVSAHILARVRLCLFYTILCSFYFCGLKKSPQPSLHAISRFWRKFVLPKSIDKSS